MIYVPDRFVFIHVPRTAGSSVTSALTKLLIDKRDILVGSIFIPESPWNKHATASQIKPHISDWHKIHKVIGMRSTEAIIASDYRLHKKGFEYIELGEYNPAWAHSCRLASKETLQEFSRRRWFPWIGNKDAYTYWADEDESYTVIDFDDLDNSWLTCLKKLNLPPIELPRLNGVGVL